MRKHPILLVIALLSYNVGYATSHCGDAEDHTGGGCEIASSTEGSIFKILGDISTTEDGAHGLYVNIDNNNTATVNGNITTSGGDAYGVYLLNADKNTITINGNITTGGSVPGVGLPGADKNTITVNGNITTNVGYGVYLNLAEENTINIRGTLSATASGIKAVYMTSDTNTNTVNFGRGAKVIGPLKNNGADTNTLHFDMGIASSYMFTTEGTTDWNLEDSSKPVVKGSANSRSAADMEDTNNRLYQRFNQLGRATSLQHKRALGNHARGMWLDGYINDHERTIVAKEIATESKGLTLGYRMWENWDVVANVESTETGYGLAEHTVESQSILAGVYNPNFMEMMQGSLAVKAFVGMLDGEGQLTVLNNAQSGNGSEIVTEDYDSVYLVAGTEWFKSFNQDSKLYHDVYIGMDLIHERMSSHKASLYFSLDDRNVTQMNSSLKYGVGYRSENSKLHVGAIGQVAYTKILSGETQDYTITTTGATATTTKFTGTEDSTYYEGSLGVGYDVSDATSVNINVQMFNSSEDIEGIVGAASIRMVL